MKKEFLKIGIALLVLFGLAIPLSLHREKKINEAISEDENTKFVNLDFETIQKIRFINKSGEVELERRKKNKDGKFADEFEARSFEFREPQEWIVIKPYRSLADSMTMNGFLNQLHLVASQKTIQDTKDRKQDYNLDPANLTIDIFDSTSPDPKLSVSMGSENPTVTGYYFMSSNKPGIYLGDRILQPYENLTLDEWKEKKIVGFADSADVEKIIVNHASQKDLSFEATKIEKDWKLGPIKDNLPGDVVGINKFLSYVDALRSRKINNDLAAIQKSKLIGDVEFTLRGRKEKLSYKVYKNEQNYIIQRNDLSSIYWISEDKKILPVFQSMISKKLVTKDISELKVMTVAYGNNILEVAKEKDDWKIKKPIQDFANIRRVEAIFQILNEIKPSLYLKNKVIDPKYQKMKLTLEFSNQYKNIATLYHEGNSFFAKIEDGNQPRIVSIPQIPMELYEHLSHMRNDSLITFSNENLHRIVFKRGESAIDIEMSTGKVKGWFVKDLVNVSSGVSMKWKEQLTAEEFYNRVSELYLVDFIDSPDPKEKYDTASLELYSNDGKSFTWKFGNKKDQTVSLYSSERNTVGKMPLDQYNELSMFLDEPKKK